MFSKSQSSPIKTMQRILVVSVNWLGDAIMTTPAFSAIKEKFPDAYTAVMVPERVQEVFTHNPFIDEVIILDEKKIHQGFIAKLNFIRDLKAKQFDTVFLIHRSFTKALICWLAGIKSRIGYRRLKNLLIINAAVLPPKRLLHRQDYYLNLFKSLGIDVKTKKVDFFIPDEVEQQVNVSLQAVKLKHNFLVGINPSANWELKRWPAENFGKLADCLIQKHNAAILFIGTAKEAGIISAVKKNMKFPSYDFSGKTNLKELGALIKNMQLFISNDSGPAHLAACLDVPTLVLFGPTAKELTAPRGERVIVIQKDVQCKIPCYQLNCRDNACMKDITVEEVMAAVLEALKRW